MNVVNVPVDQRKYPTILITIIAEDCSSRKNDDETKATMHTIPKARQ